MNEENKDQKPSMEKESAPEVTTTITDENEEKKQDIINRIEEVLEKLRPFLAREGGNIVLDHFDMETGICYVDMVGACQGCMLAESDVSDSIEIMLMDEIPEITHVQLVSTEPVDEFDNLIKQLQKTEEEKKQK